MIPYKNILCVIPARAGSQGIVDKNLLCIGGVPLVEHSILHALNAGIPSENIYVSSRQQGQATVSHWANSTANKTYGYIVVG